VSLRQCQVTNGIIADLVCSPGWPGLVELDLRDNAISDPGARQFLAADRPPGLTALRLGGNPIPDDTRAELRAAFGDVVDFADSRAGVTL
jgi:hypothetical protein